MIYAWLCPRTGSPKYVGKTSETLERRMRSHRRLALKGSHEPKYLWLGELIARGETPRVIVLQACSPETSAPIERRWVSRLGKRFPLLNVAVAGAGNPGVGRVAWTKDIDALLGTVADSEIAKKLGCHRKTVSYRREILGIPASFDRTNNVPPPSNGGWNRIAFSDSIVAQLGSMPDYQLAAISRTSKAAVARLRRARGIQSYAEQTGNTGRIKQGEPHRRWSRPILDQPQLPMTL